MITYKTDTKIVCDSLQGLIYGKKNKNKEKDSET